MLILDWQRGFVSNAPAELRARISAFTHRAAYYASQFINTRSSPNTAKFPPNTMRENTPAIELVDGVGGANCLVVRKTGFQLASVPAGILIQPSVRLVGCDLASGFLGAAYQITDMGTAVVVQEDAVYCGQDPGGVEALKGIFISQFGPKSWESPKPAPVLPPPGPTRKP